MARDLGRLQRVELRDIWKTEAQDFTPWLAGEENLALLGEALGLALELEAQEKEVGPFRADILCKDIDTDSWVLIENQLERTDHTHLGQLVTYAAGLDAVTLVWIASRFTDEHRAAFDWLNNLASDKLRCFGLEVELWKIGDSLAAPKFNIVSKPNDWSRKAHTASATAAHGESAQARLRFWTGFAELASKSAVLRAQSPSTRHFMNLAIGRTGVHLTAVFSSWNNAFHDYSGELRASLYINPKFATLWYGELEAERTKIEQEAGEALDWSGPADEGACTISVRRGADITDESDWPNQQRWLLEKLERLHGVFASRVKALPAAAQSEGTEGEG
ncbi:MAG: DUF4268 domain-containing protein [Myxococcales bacterium]|nr:DUF4268 domain-containing protein [Myxococcales bacterium]